MKAISLLSSGIDSPVATYVLSLFFDEITFMHADARPLTDDAEITNFKNIATHLSKIMSSSVKRCLVPHGLTLNSYKESKAHPRFLCIFCKRMMVRYASVYAKNHQIDCIIMGDSLGQVASQTLMNISVIDQVASVPLLRPLIGYDKEEIVNIAKNIDTFDLSIQQTLGCLAVPHKPATKARIEQLLDVEQTLPISDLVDSAINNIEYL